MSVLTVLFLVLTVVGMQALCSIHLDEAGHGGTHMDGAVGQHAAVEAPAAQHAAEVTSGHDGEDPSHCAESSPVTARYNRAVSPAVDLTGTPGLALQWLVPETAHYEPVTASGVAVAAAPSLHALGISRT